MSEETYLIHVLPGLEVLEFLLVHFELVLHHLGLLGPRQVHIAPAVDRLDVRFLEAPGIVFEQVLIHVWEVLVVLPSIEIIQLLYHFFQVLYAPLETAEFLNAELLDDSLLQGMLLDLRVGLVLRRGDSDQGSRQIGWLIELLLGRLLRVQILD